ncbi:chloramphenicol acetyltransferase [Parabacteroides sp. 52]|uniref:CatA-like O-acetyltransferase n=1 Tax=unclassified Parabacteroides TaxID=2649774 RepID=UPI0013D7B4F5|nr:MULTISPECIES: CatA-like O-acetyltransferase [unclassified Parabacteroides]MDH6533634.1 chloramphenicol O-acetyltransferase type A [Parabacteroides sp. PM5-20]NDV54386.1 chloramphenicol acetyltransferase [Parabacteroides sp. 52]
MRHLIDKQNWDRIEHFNFFKEFDDPYHGVVVDIDCTLIYTYCKKKGESFYAFYLHKMLKAINALDAFKCRIDGDEVYCYDTVHGSGTVGREDHTFGFSFYPYDPDWITFKTLVEKENQRVKEGTGLMLDTNGSRLDTIHFSAVPWFRFTSLKHARSFSNPNGTPKLSTGKIYHSDNKIWMPTQIEVHHGLIDGWHLGVLIDKIHETFCEI